MTTGRDVVTGAVSGALLGLAGHVGALVANAEGAPQDEASRRVSAELERLAGYNARFALAVLLSVMLAGALVGVACALHVRWAAPRLRAGRRTLVCGLTAFTLLALTLRAFLRQPALLEPSLGGATGALAPHLAQLARAVPPRAVTWALAGWSAALLVVGALRRRDALRRRARLALVLAVVVPLPVVVHRLTHRPRPPRLLVLAADSLRPDRFSPALTPNLTALAARGVSFDTALSPVAHTTPAWVSILTGQYPHHHGVRHMFPRKESRPAWLDWLPRRLGEAGLRTAVVSDYAGDFFPLFDMGFQSARLPPPLTLPLVFQRELVSRSPLALALLDHAPGRAAFPVLRFLMTNADPERLADEVLDTLASGDSRGQAVFVFFSTTHVPFAAPWPYYLRGEPTYGGRHRYAFDVQRLADVTASDAAQPERDVAQIRALYDGALAAVDAAAGRLLAACDERTLVVLLSDHGENLFEPGTTTHHGKWFRGGDEANRVPLVFAGAGVPRGVRRDAPVSLVDVAPTIAELLALPPRPADGVSLVPAFLRPQPERDVFAETGVWLAGPAEPDGVRYPALTELLEADPRDGFQLVLKPRYEDLVVEAKHRMLRRGPLKLVYLPTADGVRFQLYDMARDPRQREDRFGPEARPLVEAMLRFLARDPERELDARDHLVRRTED